MIEITIGILGLLIAWFTYQKTFLDKPKEEMEHLKIQFRATQATSMKVRTDLIRLPQVHGMGSTDLFAGITIDNYISLMKQTYEQNLSDGLLESVITSKPPRSLLKSVTSSLEKQHAELITLETMVNSSLSLM